MIKKLNWVHIGIILMLPIILALINPNWIFNASVADDYIYFGYQMAFPKYVGWFPSETYYFIERISWILPGYVIRQIFSPMMANFIIHLAVYYLAVFSVYGILNKLIHARVALIMAILFGQFPMVLRATGWDYLDGYGMALFAFTILLLSYSIYSPRRSYYLIGAGISYLLMFTTNFFNIFYAPALAIYLILGGELYKSPARLVKTGIYVLFGIGLSYGLLAIIYYVLTGNLLLSNSIAFSTKNVQELSAFSQSIFGKITPHWHLLMIPALLIPLVLIRQIKIHVTHRNAIMGIFIASYTMLIGWLLLGYYYTHSSIYSTNMLPLTFLMLGLIVQNNILNSSQLSFRYQVATAFFAPMIVMVALTSFGQDIFQGFIEVGIIASILISVLVVFLAQKRVYALIALTTITGFLTSFIFPMDIYNPDRYFNQTIYEQTVEAIQHINEKYDDLSLETFRLWFENADPENHIFSAITSVYLWGWDRRIGFNDIADLQTQRVIRLTSEPEIDAFIERTDTALNTYFDITLEERFIMKGAKQDIWVDFIAIQPKTIFQNDGMIYSFLGSQMPFLFEESGFHDFEQADGVGFRWTSEPIARLVFDVSNATFRTENQYVARFSVISYLEEEIVNSLTLSINGTPIPLIRDANSFTGEIDGALLMTDSLEVIFQTDRLSNPFDLGIQDGRKLGVALSELTIAPLTDDE